MRKPLLLLALLVLCSSAQAALPGLSDVLAARRLLSPGTWSRVLHIEHKDRSSSYPSSFYGLVFEMASVLWFYSPEEGTQSLSNYVGRTERDKKDVEPLLRGVFSKLEKWREEQVPLKEPSKGHVPRNACFIQSLALLEERKRQGRPIDYATLFTFYYRRDGQDYGHTVLLYEEEGKVFVADPASDGKGASEQVSRALAQDKKRLAAKLAHGHLIKDVRLLRIDAPAKSRPATAVADQGDSGRMLPSAS